VTAPMLLLFRRGVSECEGCRCVQDAVGNGMFGLLLCLALVYPSSCLVRGMVEEKETRMRETMCAPPVPPGAQRSMLYPLGKALARKARMSDSRMWLHMCLQRAESRQARCRMTNASPGA
jgi:hypothetical protein